jgi:hypothetical protein
MQKKAADKFLFVEPVGGHFILEIQWAMPHAASGSQRSQCSCECGYYHLHRNLNQACLLHSRFFSF